MLEQGLLGRDLIDIQWPSQWVALNSEILGPLVGVLFLSQLSMAIVYLL